MEGGKEDGYVGYGEKVLGGEKFCGRMREGEGDGLVGCEVRKVWGMLGGLGGEWVVLGRVG